MDNFNILQLHGIVGGGKQVAIGGATKLDGGVATEALAKGDLINYTAGGSAIGWENALIPATALIGNPFAIAFAKVAISGVTPKYS